MLWLAFVTPVMEHWLEREIAQWVNPTTHCTMSKHLAPFSKVCFV